MTRSGTRSGRVSDGRSASSTISSRPATSGAEGAEALADRRAVGRRRRAAQLDREADARAPPRDVVVEVAVQPLEPRVEVGGEGDQQQLGVHGLERERPGELAQPQARALRLRRLRARLERRAEPGRRLVGLRRHQRPARPVQQPVHLLVGDVQAAEAVARIGVRGAPAVDGGAHAALDQGQAAQQVGERRSRRRGSRSRGRLAPAGAPRPCRVAPARRRRHRRVGASRHRPPRHPGSARRRRPPRRRWPAAARVGDGSSSDGSAAPRRPGLPPPSTRRRRPVAEIPIDGPSSDRRPDVGARVDHDRAP